MKWVALYQDTLLGLLAPRRLVPIVLVSLPLLWAQYWFSLHRIRGTVLAAGVVVAFVLVAPFAWRWLGPRPEESPSRSALRLLAYGALGGGPAWLALGVPGLLRLDAGFLTAGINVAIATALFWVGGWGLGRDLDLEASLEREQARAEVLRRQAERAELLAIRTHLDPHFLFNTLNALAEWCAEDPAVAERGILELSSMLRDVLTGIGAESWPLERELRLVTELWGLHRLRDPDGIQVSRVVPDPVPRVQVPPLLLLPAAENAVKHGPAAGHRGTLALEVQRAHGEVVVRITNPGPYTGPREGSSGLDLLDRRLRLAWPDASWSIEQQGADTVLELVLPETPPEA